MAFTKTMDLYRMVNSAKPKKGGLREVKVHGMTVSQGDGGIFEKAADKFQDIKSLEGTLF